MIRVNPPPPWGSGLASSSHVAACSPYAISAASSCFFSLQFSHGRGRRLVLPARADPDPHLSDLAVVPDAVGNGLEACGHVRIPERVRLGLHPFAPVELPYVDAARLPARLELDGDDIGPIPFDARRPEGVSDGYLARAGEQSFLRTLLDTASPPLPISCWPASCVLG